MNTIVIWMSISIFLLVDSICTAHHGNDAGDGVENNGNFRIKSGCVCLSEWAGWNVNRCPCPLFTMEKWKCAQIVWLIDGCFVSLHDSFHSASSVITFCRCHSLQCWRLFMLSSLLHGVTFPHACYTLQHVDRWAQSSQSKTPRYHNCKPRPRARERKRKKQQDKKKNVKK